ncbi:MAG: hypothetical protein M3P24_05490, partial [Gemmatimonadota bacterium]|nr:hypothetical protein [Gemmatimonadota bacterium]
HTYEWYRDGVHVGSGGTYTGSTGTEPFDLSAQMTDAYGRIAWYTMRVDVDGVRVALSGPSQTWLSEGGGTWSATGIGGYTPYSFEWYVDGVYVGSGPTWSGYPGEGYHSLRVNVTDPRGKSDFTEMQVYGTGNESCAGQNAC